MKTDLASSIGVAIVGALVAYFLCNLLIVNPIKQANAEVTVKTVDSSISTELSEPNAEVFNYKALNPTVEVYVGNCEEYDSATGECIDTDTSVIEEGIIEESTESNTSETESNSATESTESTESSDTTSQGNR